MNLTQILPAVEPRHHSYPTWTYQYDYKAIPEYEYGLAFYDRLVERSLGRGIVHWDLGTYENVKDLYGFLFAPVWLNMQVSSVLPTLRDQRHPFAHKWVQVSELAIEMMGRRDAWSRYNAEMFLKTGGLEIRL